jgi:hypothetical protein
MPTLEAQNSTKDRLSRLNLVPLPPRSKTEQTLCELYNSQSQQVPDIAIGVGTQFPTASSIIAVYGNNISDKTIGSNSTTFIIDETISFINCTFFMSSCSKIKVNTGKWLAIYKSRFMCCEGRWEGIDATADRARVIMQDNRIEDANRAVILSNYTGPGVTITDNKFNRNRIGIQIEGAAGKARVFSFRRFYGNKFDCTSQVNTEAPDCQTYAKKNLYTWGFSGMLIKNISVSNLGTAGAPNLFTGAIRCGIEVIANKEYKSQTVVAIQNCRFVEIECDYFEIGILPANTNQDNSYNHYTYNTTPYADLGEGAGYGISSSNASVSVKGLGVRNLITNYISGLSVDTYGTTQSSITTFDNCSSGAITVLNSDLYMNNCYASFGNEDTNGWPAKSLHYVSSIVNCEGTSPENNIEILGNYLEFSVRDSRVNYLRAPTINIKRTSSINNISSNYMYISYSIPNPILSSSAIGLNGLGSSQATINTNYIFLDIPQGSHIYDNGIGLRNTQKVFCFKNKTTGYSYQNGILLDNSSDCVITTNTFTSSAGKITNAGLWMKSTIATNSSSSNNTICNNKVAKANIGFLFMGSCKETKFSANIMWDCVTRLKLPFDPKASGSLIASIIEPVMGQQAKDPTLMVDKEAYQNDFMNASSVLVKDAVHQGSKPNLSQFWVKEQSYISNPMLQTVTSGQDWFKLDKTISKTYICRDGIPPPSNERLSALDDALIEGTYVDKAPTVWFLEQDLMRRLELNPALLNENPQAEVFYNQRLNSNMLAYAEVADMIAEGQVVPITDMGVIETSYNLIRSKLSAINVMIMDIGDVTWTTEQEAQYNEYAEDIAILAATINTQINSIEQQRLGKVLAAQEANNALNPSTELENDIKKINSLTIKSILGQELNPTEEEIAYSIAGKCFSAVGGEIQRANDFLPYNRKHNLNAAASCLDGTPPVSGRQQAGTAKVYPNPVNGLLTIILDSKERGTKVSLVNIMGQIVMEKAINSDNQNLEFDVQSLSNGIYTLTIWKENVLLNNTKVVVAHP